MDYNLKYLKLKSLKGGASSECITKQTCNVGDFLELNLGDVLPNESLDSSLELKSSELPLTVMITEINSTKNKFFIMYIGKLSELKKIEISMEVFNKLEINKLPPNNELITTFLNSILIQHPKPFKKYLLDNTMPAFNRSNKIYHIPFSKDKKKYYYLTNKEYNKSLLLPLLTDVNINMVDYELLSVHKIIDTKFKIYEMRKIK